MGKAVVGLQVCRWAAALCSGRLRRRVRPPATGDDYRLGKVRQPCILRCNDVPAASSVKNKRDSTPRNSISRKLYEDSQPDGKLVW